MVLLVSDASRAQVPQEKHHGGGQHPARGSERTARRGQGILLSVPVSANWTPSQPGLMQYHLLRARNK